MIANLAIGIVDMPHVLLFDRMRMVMQCSATLACRAGAIFGLHYKPCL